MKFLDFVGLFMVISAGFADPLPPASRIVNGDPATASNWTVSFQMEWCMYRNAWCKCYAIPKSAQRTAPRGYSHFCTGTFIEDDLVVTAGHCCEPMLKEPRDKYRVVAGVTSLTDPLAVKQFLAIENIHNHPQYSSTTLDNDVCLCRLTSAMVTAETAGRIKVAKITSNPPETDYEGADILLSGWGQTSTEGSASSVLNLAKVKGANKAECATAYGSIVTPKTICTSSQRSGACFGDSGGPLMVLDDFASEYRLAGVISFVSGSGCGSGVGHPDGHQEIKHYMGWMCDIVKKYRSVDWC